MTHTEFVTGWSNGEFGCAIKVSQALALFSSTGSQRKGKDTLKLSLVIIVNLICVGFLFFVYLPLIWATIGLLTTIAALSLVIAHDVTGRAIERALIDEAFFKEAVCQRALLLCCEEGLSLTSTRIGFRKGGS